MDRVAEKRALGSGSHHRNPLEAQRGVVEFPVPDSDAALVRALCANRPAARAALFDRYSDHVRRVLTRVLGPDPEISDLLQDVFVTALESIERLKEPSALKAWLSRIAVFTARGRIRRRVRWRFLRLVAQGDLPEVEATVVSAEISEALNATYRVLERLKPDERIAFALRFIDSMELTEVASACDVSLATIKRRLSRAQGHFIKLARDEAVLKDWIERGSRWT